VKGRPKVAAGAIPMNDVLSAPGEIFNDAREPAHFAQKKWEPWIIRTSQRFDGSSQNAAVSCRGAALQLVQGTSV
jgi:hypothetical protein